jgi:hypothetical protein
MSENAVQHPASATAGLAVLARRTLPIGARYPRGWPVSGTGAPTTTSTNVRRAYLPPVGCRFPRAGQTEYSEPVPTPVPVPGPPVGARFPRSSAWHSESLMESTLFV